MKTIFDPAVRSELIGRVSKLSAKSEKKFGSMRPDQGIHHINIVLQAYLGEVKTVPPSNKFIATLMKLFTFSPLPIPPEKGRTAPPFVAGSSYSIETEKARFPGLIERVAGQRDLKEWPISPVFGKLSGDQYGKLAYKHTDHHLKQFGV
jgi:hypothetical protein